MVSGFFSNKSIFPLVVWFSPRTQVCKNCALGLPAYERLITTIQVCVYCDQHKAVHYPKYYPMGLVSRTWFLLRSVFSGNTVRTYCWGVIVERSCLDSSRTRNGPAGCPSPCELIICFIRRHIVQLKRASIGVKITSKVFWKKYWLC